MLEFDYFTVFVMPPLVIGVGLLGNLCGILVILQKNLLKIGPRDIYFYLFISDTTYLLFIAENYLIYAFSFDITILSKYVCKLYYYLSYTLAAISPWLLSKYSFFNILFVYLTKKSKLFLKSTFQSKKWFQSSIREKSSF